MAYVKKIEPIAKYEVVLCGLTLLLWVIFLQVLPWGVTSCRNELFVTDVSDKESLTDFHNCMKEDRTALLTGTVFLLLGYPIIIAHVYYIYRLFETLLSFVNIGYNVYLYMASWMMVAAIYCTLLPATVIFVAYYDWEFGESLQYAGYAMQYQMTHFNLILWDCLIIPLGFTAALPWFWGICFVCGLFKSSFYSMAEDAKFKLFGRFMGCPRAAKCTLVCVEFFLMLLCFFGAFADVFDYEKEGFFSFNGDSQWLFVVLYISWLLFGIVFIVFGCKLDAHRRFLDENVKPLSQL